MTKTNVNDAPDPETGADATDKATVTQTPATAMDTLRADGREPLRIWKVKGPKGVGGEIAAVLCQDDNTIVLVHTLDSGKFSVFAKGVKA